MKKKKLASKLNTVAKAADAPRIPFCTHDLELAGYLRQQGYEPARAFGSPLLFVYAEADTEKIQAALAQRGVS